MQAGVDKWEAAGFLGMSVEMLDRIYGHHHPLHLRQAANATGYRRQKETLSVSLSKPKPASFNATQVVDIAGGGHSHLPTGLRVKFPANRDLYRDFSDSRHKSEAASSKKQSKLGFTRNSLRE